VRIAEQQTDQKIMPSWVRSLGVRAGLYYKIALFFDSLRMCLHISCCRSHFVALPCFCFGTLVSLREILCTGLIWKRYVPEWRN